MADAEATSSNAEPNPAYFAGEPSTNPPEEQENTEEIYEPESKRKKTEKTSEAVTEKLEHRLGGILCCAVCLDLPRAAVYQCTNGHLMCAGCFTHLLADARLRDEVATCPNCRVEIGRSSASRNLAVEKAVSELPAECQYCNREFPRNSLDRHQESLCEERITNCRFARIGCPWRGPWHEASSHEAACAHPTRTGLEVMEALQAASVVEERERRLYDSIFELLSYEKITFNDLQMKPYRSDELVHKLFYETSRFTAFNNQWVVKARVTGSQRDPTQSSHREITYQLILKTKTAVPMSVHHLVVHGPFGDARVLHRINRFDFSDQDSESPEVQLPLADVAECNRLLASKAINFRAGTKVSKILSNLSARVINHPGRLQKILQGTGEDKVRKYYLQVRENTKMPKIQRWPSVWLTPFSRLLSPHLRPLLHSPHWGALISAISALHRHSLLRRQADSSTQANIALHPNHFIRDPILRFCTKRS